MPRVFLSYSHDDEKHRARVHGLADRLAGEGDLQILLDRDAGPGGPDEGWPAWSERQVREADFVLIVCSEEYAHRYGGNDGGSDGGRGTVIEARAIQQYLYDDKGINTRFRVVLFDPAHKDFIPHQLRGYKWFNANDDAGYAALLAWLRAKGTSPEPPAADGPIWPEPDLGFTLPLADRREPFKSVRNALSGRSSKRILLCEGEGASGKTEFLTELSRYADRLKIPWSRFDFKGAPPLEWFFDRILLDLGADLLPDTNAGKRSPLVDLVTDLQQLRAPLLLLFDTYEQASEDAQLWLESSLLPSVRKLPAVVVVVGGRTVPDKERFPWRSLAELCRLDPIHSVDEWRDYIEREHEGKLAPDEVELLVNATEGRPGMFRPLIETLAKKRNSG